MQDIHKLCWSMIAIQNTTHGESLHACFALRFLSPGRWEGLVCRNVSLYNVLAFSTTKRLVHGTSSSLVYFMQGKKEFMSTTWKYLAENVFPLACIDNRPVTPKSWGWSAPPCITVGLSETCKQKLKYMVWLSVPHCVCRAVWSDLLLISLPDNSSSFEAVVRTSWLCQTLFHPSLPPSWCCPLFEDWRIWTAFLLLQGFQ